MFRTAILVLLIAGSVSAAEKVVGTLAEHGVKEIVFAERTFVRDGHWYANFGYNYAGPKAPMSGTAGRLCKLEVATGKVTVLIDDPKGAVRDPKVHYDAKKILFSYRKGGTAQYHLYEINVDGSNLQQLTDGIYDDLEATYLPDGGIMFVSSRSKRWVNCWVTQVANLHRCDADGKNIRVISVNIEEDNTPWVLPDGRILFTRWEYVDRSQVRFHHLWTCNPDGSEQKIYFGNTYGGGLFIDAKPIPNSERVVFIDSPGHGSIEHTGRIATVSDKHGPDARERRELITGHGYRDPYALSDKLFVAAYQQNIIGVVDNGQFTPLHRSETALHEPRPIIKQKRERVIPSRIDLTKDYGTLILNNVYIGQKMDGIEKGEIKKLLILETLPKPLNHGGGLHDFLPISHGGTFTLERILGSVPVEADGSAHFKVPANRPLFFIAVNEKNESIKRMHSFLSVMPGEVLSCVGCHEDRSQTPKVRTDLHMAMKRPANEIKPVPGVPYMIDFPTHVQPILTKHCAECHNPDQPDGRVILSGDHGPVYSHSYFCLTSTGIVSDGRNGEGNSAPRSVGDSASQLMKMLEGSHYDAKLSSAEVEMVRNWIHIGAPYPGTYAALGTGMVRGNNLPRTHHAAKVKADQAFERSCLQCHPRNRLNGMERYSIAGGKNKSTYFWDSHLAYNLSKPEKSLVLLAPLSDKAGGWGACKARDDSAKQKEAARNLFSSTKNEDYLAILRWIEQGKLCLEQNKRWDMPGFKPHPFYVREMKRYGILPEQFDLGKDDIDAFETDRRYFESSWYYPKGDGPKLYDNTEFSQQLQVDGRGS